MCNCVLLDDDGIMKEEISASEFAELKTEVSHQGSDIAEIKKSTEKTTEAITSISLTLATMSEHVKQNAKIETRVKDLEDRQKKTDIKIAAFIGGGAAISGLAALVAKIKGWF